MLTAIVGINWGDEGKGRMVDLLSENYDIVARYQGGNNAGHTVQNHLGKFILNLLPSGILRPDVVNVMGPGMVIDLQHLCGEIDRLRQAGIRITPDNLKISDRAIICLPYHVQQDGLEEDRLGDAKYGSTRRGIAPVYGDKYLKKGIRMGDLLYPEAMKKRLRGIVEWKDLFIHDGYKADHLSYDEIVCWLETYGGRLKEYVCDLGVYLTEQIQNGKSVMFEAQLGALRDIDFGIYPFTSSSSTISAYAPIGAGNNEKKLDLCIGSRFIQKKRLSNQLYAAAGHPVFKRADSAAHRPAAAGCNQRIPGLQPGNDCLFCSPLCPGLPRTGGHRHCFVQRLSGGGSAGGNGGTPGRRFLHPGL